MAKGIHTEPTFEAAIEETLLKHEDVRKKN